MLQKKVETARGSRRGPPAELCGAAIIVLGVLAFLIPLLAPALASGGFAGVLLAAGAVGAFTLTSGAPTQRLWRGLWVAAASLTGLAALYHHSTGRLSLPWIGGLGAAALAAVAIGHLAAGPGHRASWPGALAGGITLAMGALLFRAAPHAAVMILALFIAVSLIGYGLSLIVAGLLERAAATLL